MLDFMSGCLPFFVYSVPEARKAIARPEVARSPGLLRSSVRQREDRQRAAQFGVLVQFAIAAHGAEAVGVLLEARGHADAGPATDAREHADVLLALVLIREHVAD